MEEQKERRRLKPDCGRVPGRENALVFGEGPQNPKLMLIGEAPGEQESLKGRPFVGKAGKNLITFWNWWLGAVRKFIFQTSSKSARRRQASTGRLSNRPPTKEEMRFLRPWLMAEIARVNPCHRYAGQRALQAVTDSRLTIGEAHGKLMTAGETAGRFSRCIIPPADLQPFACARV
ncbi:MAG: uracil-DNA glycosylase family protein [Christensenellales bacterium]